MALLRAGLRAHTAGVMYQHQVLRLKHANAGVHKVPRGLLEQVWRLVLPLVLGQRCGVPPFRLGVRVVPSLPV